MKRDQTQTILETLLITRQTIQAILPQTQTGALPKESTEQADVAFRHTKTC